MHFLLDKHNADILIPLQNELLHLKSRMCSRRTAVTQLRSEIFSLREQGHVLAELRTKGFLSDSKYQEQTAELQTKISRRKRQLSLMMRSEDDDGALEQIGQHIGYFENRNSLMEQFEDDVFAELIDRITVTDEHDLTFYLPGGFYFTEQI